MDEAPKWNLTGWDRLTAHDDPALVAARREFQAWLDEIPEPHQTTWRKRLESTLDAAHYSVRLELFLHH